MNLPRLMDFPVQYKWLITLLVISFALNHLSSGVLVWEVTRHASSSAQEHFENKTLAALLRMTHQHTFGHGTMYFLTSAIFLLAEFPAGWALAVITLPFAGAWLDIFSWFMLKYSSEQWEYLSMFSGVLYSVSFAVMIFTILRQMWLPKKGDE